MSSSVLEPAAMTALASALQDERGALIENNVEALLRAHDESGGLLPRQADPAVDATQPAPQPGRGKQPLPNFQTC